MVEQTMTTAELEKMLKDRKAAEKAEADKKRKEYESSRDELVDRLASFAEELEGQMRELKYVAFRELIAFRDTMLEYGQLRRKEMNKGNFEIKTDKYKVMFTSQVNKRFDERAQLAEGKLKTFIDSFVKKRDIKTYQLVKSLLERNPKTGDYDIDLINRLYSMEDSFDDQNWKDALKLFKESYSPYGTAQYVRFFVKNETNNSWEPIVLDFAKLKIDGYEIDTEATSEA